MQEKNLPKILIISGPTGSGKSALAKIIASKFKGAIINADSMQIYRELPILSAQPSSEDLKELPHYLYSIFDYSQNSSVALWLSLATKTIDEVRREVKLPIVVGGTGLYISKLLDGINKLPQISDEIRNFSRKFYEELGKEQFIKNLITLGENEDKIQNLDKQRLIRRFEVLKQTSKTLDWHLENNSENKEIFYNQESFIHINLEPDRKKLYENCNARFVQMLENGAIEEVSDFLKRNSAKINDEIFLNSLVTKTIGYAEIRDYLHGKISKEKLIEIASQKTRNYAKRQLTWFRHQFKNKIIIENFSSELNKIFGIINENS